MSHSNQNRFDDFFSLGAYRVLKNHLYNYRLRKRAMKRCFREEAAGTTLEVGSGLSPMSDDLPRVVYSDLSFLALKNLKECRQQGGFVVADAAHLPFKAGAFTRVICSEVLEHLPDDRSAIKEMAMALQPMGSLLLTFPHRRGYFAVDDRFVKHLRRYEIAEMEEMLREGGLLIVDIKKVLGPLEKAAMISVTTILNFTRHLKGGKGLGRGQRVPWPIIIPLFKWLNNLLIALMWLDARVFPRALSAVILIRAVKSNS